MFAESSYFYGTGTGTHRHRGMAVKAKRAAEMHAQQRQGAQFLGSRARMDIAIPIIGYEI
jgi:hypothetical protein